MWTCSVLCVYLLPCMEQGNDDRHAKSHSTPAVVNMRWIGVKYSSTRHLGRQQIDDNKVRNRWHFFSYCFNFIFVTSHFPLYSSWYLPSKGCNFPWLEPKPKPLIFSTSSPQTGWWQQVWPAFLSFLLEGWCGHWVSWLPGWLKCLYEFPHCKWTSRCPSMSHGSICH